MPIDSSQFSGKTYRIRIMGAPLIARDDVIYGALMEEDQALLWQLVDAGAGQFYIRSSDGKVLAAGEASEEGWDPPIKLEPQSSAAHQRWTLEDAGDGAYFIISVSSGLLVSRRLAEDLSLLPKPVVQTERGHGNQQCHLEQV